MLLATQLIVRNLESLHEELVTWSAQYFQDFILGFAKLHHIFEMLMILIMDCDVQDDSCGLY